MASIGLLLLLLMRFYFWVIVVGVVLSWLIALDVVNMRNRIVRMAYDVTNRMTEPVLRPIRRFLPDLGGIDISPMILIILLIVAQDAVTRYLILG